MPTPRPRIALYPILFLACAACGSAQETTTETHDELTFSRSQTFTRSRPPPISTAKTPAFCRAVGTSPAAGSAASSAPAFRAEVTGDCTRQRVAFSFDRSFTRAWVSAWSRAPSTAPTRFDAGDWYDVLYEALRDGRREIFWKVEGQRPSGAVITSPVQWFSLASSYVAAEGALGLRYDDVRAKSAHNAYERDEALIDQLVYHRIRSIEIDIHHSKSGHPSLTGDWYVFHDSRIPGGRSTTCHRFSDCLGEVASFGRITPNHEVVTLFVDLKDGFRGGQTAEQFDAMLQRFLSPSKLFTPEHLTAGCPAAGRLQDTVTGECRWPQLRNLRGKVMVVLTGPQDRLDGYLAGTDRGRVAFVARGISTAQETRRHPDTVFFNLPAADRFIAPEIKAAGFVSRVYFLNSDTFDGALTLGIHHLGVNEVSYLEDPNVRTHNDHGYPFSCFDISCEHLQEDEHIIGIQVASGDIWSRDDSFHFVGDHYASSRGVWTAAVSSPNSAVEEWAKGCLMVRSSLSSDAANFAVCRPADEQRVRVQWRGDRGEKTHRVEESFVRDDTVDPESLVHLRLMVWSEGSRDCASGWSSIDGLTWHRVGEPRCFSVRLRHQGLAASSHDHDRSIRFLFADVRRDEQLQSLSTLGTRTQVHSGTGAAFTGSL